MSSQAAPSADERPAAGQAGPRTAAGLGTEHDIELVLAFLNTRDTEHDTDVLDRPEQWRDWCAARDLDVVDDCGAVREFRDALRSAVTGTRDEACPLVWPARVELRGEGPVLTGSDALGAVLAAGSRLVVTGHWDRIKICPAHDCLWAFYDRSRNRSRTWCSMSVCGNREKARSWRERHTGI